MSNNGSSSTLSPSSRARISSKTSFHLLAGLLSGLTSSVLLQPADLLKTRVQQQQQTGSLLPALRTILSSPQPVRNLWRGTLPSALRTGVGSALYFTALNVLREGVAHAQNTTKINNNVHAPYSTSALPRLSNTANLVTGAFARVAAGFIMMPVTVLKVRYESDFYAYRNLVEAARDIVRSEGIRGLFTGFGATAVRDAPYAGLYVLFYEQFKRSLTSLYFLPSNSHSNRSSNSRSSAITNPLSPPTSPLSLLSLSSLINFASGAFAAGLATAITNPFDAIKTRLQLMPGRYRNMVRAGQLMIREDGVRSLFRGLGLRMARKALSSALSWTVYEELILRAEKRWAMEGKKIEL